MKYPTNCPNCGYLITYLPDSRMIGCSRCGTIIDPLDNWENEKTHDNMIALSGEHIRAGNWDEAISLLTPLSSLVHPADKRVYEFILTAATEDFTAFDISEEKRKLAMKSWDSLDRLNGITSKMIDYSLSKYNTMADQTERITSFVYFFLFTSAVLAVLAAICFVTSHYIMMFLFILGVSGSLGLAGFMFLGGGTGYYGTWSAKNNPFN